MLSETTKQPTWQKWLKQLKIHKDINTLQERIKDNFTESIQIQIAAAETLSDTIQHAAMTLIQSLLNGNKVLCCGNGASATSAQNFSSRMVSSFEIERPSLPAITLAADAILFNNNNHPQNSDIYARQIRALANSGDILLAISIRGDNHNVIRAIETAVTRDLTIIALTGCDGGEISGLLGPEDVEIRIPSHHTPRIQEMHTFILNLLCDLIEQTLFPHQPDH